MPKKAYRQELNALVADAQEMSDLLNAGRPDPIQGQIITDTVQAHLIDEGHPTLREERTALLNATEAVRGWSQARCCMKRANDHERNHSSAAIGRNRLINYLLLRRNERIYSKGNKRPGRC